MLREAIQIIRELLTGELVDWKGEYFEVDSARLWDLPEVPVRDRGGGVRRPLGRAVRTAGRPPIAVEPDERPRRLVARRAAGDRPAG